MSPSVLRVMHNPRFRIFLLLMPAVVLWACLTASAQEEPAQTGGEVTTKPRTEVIWEWGAYYTSVGLNIPLTDEAVPEGGEMSETEVYATLLANSLRPRVLLLEASVYPMPILGTWIRSHEPGLYEDAWIAGHRVNLLQALTAGFQEPWAVSVFFGNQIRFTRRGEQDRDTNRGYMGYLVSAGKKHIRDDVLIDDDWLELEWKMKGERKFAGERLSWSFRAGTKFHRNPEIANVVYLGIGRSNLDFGWKYFSWLKNSRVYLLTEFTSDSMTFARQELLFAKKLPLQSCRCALELGVGLIYESDVKYTGSLANTDRNALSLVLRPNLEF
ncbi:MAG: hypothetical protein ACKVP2_00225 [Burkholderiales bacterium]